VVGLARAGAARAGVIALLGLMMLGVAIWEFSATE